MPDSAPRDPTDVANLAALVTAEAEQHPDAVALTSPSTAEELTWSDLEAQVAGVASGLAAGRIVAGQRIGLRGRNSVAFVVSYLAALRAGLVVVPVDPEASAEDAGRLFEMCGVKEVITDSAADTFGVPRVVMSDSGLRDLAEAGHDPAVSPPDHETLAALLTTAGTSGDPKIVMLTHRALLSHLGYAPSARVVQADDVMLGALPFFHVFGLGSVVGTWLAAGARLVLADVRSDDLLDVVRSERVTHLPVTPSLLYRLMNDARPDESLSSVRTVFSAAAPLPWRLAQNFADLTGVRVEQGYGLTEACTGVSATFGGRILGPSHVGRPLPGVEVRIGDGSEPREPAEIFVRGGSLFSGYWPDGTGGPDRDGWFGTDDIGYLNEGELFLVDRARELVVVNGFRVYPTEVEQVIRQLPEVRAVAVVGRADERTGQGLVAFVAGDGVSAEEVLSHCSTRLAPFKRPVEVRLVEDLPRGVTGKVMRAALRAMVEPVSR